MLGGMVAFLNHLELEGGLLGLFRNDLLHLSDVGIDIFHLGIVSLSPFT